MNRLKMKSILALAVMAMIPMMMSAQLMKGTAKLGEDPDFVVNYMPEGNLLLAQTKDVNMNADGTYTFDMDMDENELDVEIYIDDQVFGAHLQKGKTVIFNVERTADGKYITSFAGDNAARSELVSTMYSAYDLMTYSSQDDEGPSADEQLKKLDAAHQNAMSKLKLIKDKKLKAYYTELLQAMYNGTKARVLEDKALTEKKEVKDNPEYQAIINSIDPNSDISYITFNSLLWISAKSTVEDAEFKGNMWPQQKEYMDNVDKYITNPKVKKMCCYIVPNSFFAYGDHETGKEEFWARYKEFAKDYPEIIESYIPEYNKKVEKFEGKPLPEFMLDKKDGTQVSVTTLNGKYTYVDCWATWCGPCCREIPHLEKLVDKMAGNDKIQFVSFSMDTDHDAWLKKIEKDQPKWAQYILSDAASKTLSDALNITGIPRFFILDPEGNVINQDAKRPSDEDIETYLNDLTK